MLSIRLSCSVSYLLLAAAGCGSPATFADAGPGADADLADASGARGPVTVHVTSSFGTGAPDTDATVYFADAGGSLIETATTDDAGMATGLVDPGGSVTVQFSGGLYALRSIMGVEVGDDLWFGGRASAGAGTMTVTVPAATGATSYHVVGPCVSSIQGLSTSIGVTLTPGCSATRTLLAIADRGAMPDQYLPISDVTPAGGATVTATGPWLDELAGPPAQVTGIPTDATSRLASSTWWSDGRAVIGRLGTIGAGEPAAATLVRPPGIDEAVTAIISTSGSSWTYQVEVHYPTVPTSALSIDATPILPVLDPQEVAGGITWTATAGVADAIYVSTEALGDKGETVAVWDFFVPPDADGVAYPAIPGRPEVGLMAVRVTEIDVVPGYDALRARAAIGDWPANPPLPSPSAYVRHVASFL